MPQNSVDPGCYYENESGALKLLKAEVVQSLTTALDAAGITIHSVTGRVKTKNSFLQKLRRKSIAPHEVRDLVGIRVVCLGLTQLETIEGIINEKFTVLKREDKSLVQDLEGKKKKDADQLFGYSSIHYDCRIREEYAGPHYDPIKKRTFEIQVRTILMDAWASVSHHLAYKGAASIPEEHKRDLFALSALFHIADRQFEAIMSASQESQNETAIAFAAADSDAPGDLPINRDTVRALLKEDLPKRELDDLDTISMLVEEIANLGKIENVDDLRVSINRGMPSALEDEKINPPGSEEGFDADGNDRVPYTAVGIVRTALDNALPGFAERKEYWRLI